MKNLFKFLKDNLILVIALVWQGIILLRIDRFIWSDGIVEPWFITKGLMFDKDFYSTYLPFPKLLMIPVNLVFNWNFGTTVAIGFILTMATIFLIYKMSESKIISVVYFLIMYSYILAQNTFDINLFLGFLILIMIGIYFSWIKKQTKLKVLLVGLVGACAIFSTQHTVIPLMIICLAMIFYSLKHKLTLRNVLINIITPLCVGFLILAGPIIIWYIIRGALGDLYFWAFDYYLRDNGYPFTKFGFSERDSIMIVIFSIPIIVFTFGLIKTTKKRWELVVFWIVIIASMIYALFSLFHPRRLLFILPLTSVMIGYLPGFVKTYKSKILTILSTFSMGIFGVYLIMAILPWYSEKIYKGTKFLYYNQVQPGEADYLAVEWVRKNTDPNSKINVFSGNTLNYIEAQRLPANQRTYSIPWVYEPFEETKIIFRDKPSDYWIVDERLINRFVQWEAPHQAKYIRQYLSDNFSKVASFDYMSVYKLKTGYPKK